MSTMSTPLSPLRGRLSMAAAVALFAVAGLVGAYAVWAYRETSAYLGELEASGQLVRTGNEFDITTAYVVNAGQYAILAILLAGVGGLALAVRRLQSAGREGALHDEKPAAEPEADEDELDDLLASMDDTGR